MYVPDEIELFSLGMTGMTAVAEPISETDDASDRSKWVTQYTDWEDADEPVFELIRS